MKYKMIVPGLGVVELDGLVVGFIGRIPATRRAWRYRTVGRPWNTRRSFSTRDQAMDGLGRAVGDPPRSGLSFTMAGGDW